MEFLIILTLGIVGAALVAGGFVAYRRSDRTGVKAFSAAAVAAGVVMWATIVLVTPVSETTSGPDPIESGVEADLQQAL
ncbi:MAG: hypothetical protein V3R87_12730 [Dehalococcoidia bacterium]